MSLENRERDIAAREASLVERNALFAEKLQAVELREAAALEAFLSEKSAAETRRDLAEKAAAAAAAARLELDAAAAAARHELDAATSAALNERQSQVARATSELDAARSAFRLQEEEAAKRAAALQCE